MFLSLKPWTLAVLSLATSLAGVRAQTATDGCVPTAGNEYNVTLGGTCSWQTFNKLGTFTNTNQPGGCSSGNYGDGWGWFTALNTTTTITFDPASSHRPILHVFTGTCGGTLTQVACNNSGGAGVNATVTIASTPGTVYLIRIQRHNDNAAMNGSLCILSPHSTDACALSAANKFTSGTSCQFEPFNKPDAYVADTNPGGCNSGNYDDGWGWFTATDVQTVITFDPDASLRPILHVFSGSCGSLTQLACNDAGAAGVNAEVAITTVPGQNYMFRIQQYNSNNAMNGQVCVWTPASTDACALVSQNQFSVSTSCAFQPFHKPVSYAPDHTPTGCGSGNFDDAWGWFTATDVQTVITYDPDASLRPILHVFSGTCGSLTQVGCHDGGALGANAEVVIATVPGQNYLFRVQRQGNSGAMDGQVCIWTPASTDDCAMVTQNQFSVSTSCTFQPFHKPEAYVPNVTPTGCNGGNYDDAWGWFTATDVQTVITFDPDASLRPILHVFSGICGSLTQVACHDAGATGANAQVSITTVPGQNYLFRIQRQGSSGAMDGGICIWTPASTDACAFVAQNQFNVTTGCGFQPFHKPEAYVPNVTYTTCNGGNYDDAWGWFTATGTSTVITFDPDASLRPILHVFSGSCGSLTQVACHDGGSNGANAQVVITTVIGQNYAFRIQRQGSSGAMDGGVCIRTITGFDDCYQSQFLPALTSCYFQTFSNTAAVRSPQTPNPSCGGTINDANLLDVWFNFTAPLGGQVLIETQAGTMTNGAMQLYSGTCGSLTAIECDDDDGPGDMPMIDRRCNPLVAGQTYYIRFWGRNGQVGSFGICVSGPGNFQPMQEDCVGSQLVCGDAAIINNATTNGCTQDLNSGNRGCLGSNERQGTWYYFSPSASGTIEFTITPTANVDYDFAIWGPLSSFACPPAGTPVRCSYAWPNGISGYPAASAFLTGLRAGNTDTSEPAQGTTVNGFAAPMDVLAGQVYILYVDNFDVTGQSFNLDWNLTNGCSLDCTVLPVEIFSFEAHPRAGRVELLWSTASENGSSHFEVEHGLDPMALAPIAMVPAAGSSLVHMNYTAVHESPRTGVNYYRLKQVDQDGSIHYSEIVAVTYTSGPHMLLPRPNPARSMVQADLPEGLSGAFTVDIADATGRIVRSSSGFGEGVPFVSVPLDDLEAGSYTLMLTNASGEVLGVGRFIRE